MPDRSEALRRRLLATFRVEAEEHLGTIARTLDLLTGGPDAAEIPALLDALFRTMHTLKGAARSVGRSEVESRCAASEELLRRLTRGEQALDAAALARLREAADAMARLNAEGAGDAPPPSRPAVPRGPASPPAHAGPPRVEPQRIDPQRIDPARIDPARVELPPGLRGTEVVRLEARRLDHIIQIAEDLMAPRLVGGERGPALAALADRVQALRAEIRSPASRGEAASVDIQAALRSIETEARRQAGALAADYRVLRTAVDDLTDEMRSVRLMPASDAIEAFPRMVRDLCRETGKDARFEASGGDLQIDRKVLGLAKDALIQLVRNAVDHGIEPPEARAQAGKPPQGRVSVSFAWIDGRRMRIEVADDGRGLDAEALREAAVRSRVLPGGEAREATDETVWQLAFRAGVSTSPVITGVSGHGLGLAIVRERVEQLDGQVSVRSGPGAGTVVSLELPASVAAYRGLVLRTGDVPAVLPVDTVERVIGVPAAAAPIMLARGLIELEGEALPFGHLAAILGAAAAPAPEEPPVTVPCVVLRAGAGRGVVQVDAIGGVNEVLVKELRPPLRRVPFIAAAGLLPTGTLALVLRAADVLASIHTPAVQAATPAVPGGQRRLRILVVDDSITTRTMERNLFEAAGYEVTTAADGVDAWNLLQGSDVDLVVSDVDMPLMDGFALTERIRADPRLQYLPVVLVTALEAREDKERGVRVGANAYVLKSGFDQSDLLGIVGRLI